MVLVHSFSSLKADFINRNCMKKLSSDSPLLCILLLLFLADLSLEITFVGVIQQ